jgi:hypothetical protein
MKNITRITRRKWITLLLSSLTVGVSSQTLAQTKFKRIRTQYIAALAQGNSTSGTGAETWGLWRIDPWSNWSMVAVL